MKNSLKLTVFIALFLVGLSCDREEFDAARKGNVSFIVHEAENSGGGRSKENSPAAIFLSLEDTYGNVIVQNRKLSLLAFGQGYVSESLELNTGGYRLTKFLVLDDSANVIYATPLEGSEKATLVADPLPINFSVDGNTALELIPQILEVTLADTPESFGYTGFGFEVIGWSEILKVKVKVELKVGEIDYLNIDTKILVKGYDSLNQVKWQNEFSYAGPDDNVLFLKAGYRLYSFEIQHWGVYDKQSMTAEHLRDGRADGPAPVTYVLGGALEAKKLSHYDNYLELRDTINPASTYLLAQYRVEYAYSGSGKLDKMTFFNYDLKTRELKVDRYFIFSWLNGRLDKITGYHAENDQPYIEDFYEYHLNGNISRITENNTGTGTDWVVNLLYNYTDRVIDAVYTASNGGEFHYSLFYDLKNIKTDKTLKAGVLCNQGSYTYDKNINPLKHLGYVDFLMRNFSINNRLTEDIEYYGCSFPSLEPDFYHYQYNSLGYPTIATTVYKSTGDHKLKSVNKYYYK